MTISAALRTRTVTRSRRLFLPSFLVAAVTATIVWLALSSLEGHHDLARALTAGREELLAPALGVMVVALAFCERVRPAEKRDLIAKGHVHDALFVLLHVATVVPLMTLMGVAFDEFLTARASWLELHWTTTWPRWPLLLVALVLMDGGNWLAHYADHRFRALWRFHALHHTQEELNVLTSFRAHPLSHVTGFFLATVPVVVLMGDRGMAPALVTAYVCLGTLPHANVRWSFGPIGKVLVSPAYHRLHHSHEGSKGSNLGIVLTVWDVLSGRARFPESDATWFPTGLESRPLRVEQEGASHLAVLVTQLVEPFTAAPTAP